MRCALYLRPARPSMPTASSRCVSDASEMIQRCFPGLNVGQDGRLGSGNLWIESRSPSLRRAVPYLDRESRSILRRAGAIRLSSAAVTG